MAESIWSYEGDVAPQKGSYFPDAAPSRAGSRFTYSTPDAQRYAAGVLAPAQAAIRQAEEDERKRRDDEMVFQRNKALLEEGKEQSRMRREALEFINNPEVATQLSAIDQKISVDPIQAQKELSDWTMKNISGIESSSVLKENIAQIRERINQAQLDTRQKDADQFIRVKLLVENNQFGRAKEEAAKIKDSGILGNANILLEARGAANESAQAKADSEAKQEQDKDRQDAQQRVFGNIYTQLSRMKMVTPPPSGGPGSPQSEAAFDPIDQIALEAMAEEIGVDPKLPPKDLYKTILKKTYSSRVDGFGNGGNVGEVTGGMMPSTP
jgi:hypothetical protein